jgi:hypothetical protein
MRTFLQHQPVRNDCCKMRVSSIFAAMLSLCLGINSPAATFTNSTATLTGAVNPIGVSTTAWFEWGLGPRFDQVTTPTALGSGVNAVSFTNTIAGLIPGLAYNFRVVASNNLGTITRGVSSALLAPTFSLIGANPLTNTWGAIYTEPGATATGFPVSLVAGRAHTAALKAGNTIAVWGDNSLKQTNSPASATNLIAIAAGQNHVVAARANGTVVAWGENNSNQTNVISAASNVVAVAAGESFCLALRTNGTVIGWGDSFYGQTNAPTGSTNVSAIAAGQRHCLALRNTGTIIAWGYNGFGQTNVPAGATGVKAIAAGSGHSLALKTDGSVLVWGLNSYFQTNIPPTVTNVVAIAAGFYHSLALRADGTVVAWGAGTNNTGVTPHFGQSLVPSSATNVIAIAAGYYHSLAMRADGSIIAWGAGTTSTGSFPNFGQAIVPSGLNVISPTLFASGAVNTNLTGSYPIHYTVTNAFGGVATASRIVFVTSPPPSPTLISSATLPGGSFQFSFTNATPINFTVLASTNMALPTSNWTVLGSATVISSGVYQFTDAQATNLPRRFYQVRSP